MVAAEGVFAIPRHMPAAVRPISGRPVTARDLSQIRMRVARKAHYVLHRPPLLASVGFAIRH